MLQSRLRTIRIKMTSLHMKLCQGARKMRAGAEWSGMLSQISLDNPHRSTWRIHLKLTMIQHRAGVTVPIMYCPKNSMDMIYIGKRCVISTTITASIFPLSISRNGSSHVGDHIYAHTLLFHHFYASCRPSARLTLGKSAKRGRRGIIVRRAVGWNRWKLACCVPRSTINGMSRQGWEEK